MEPSRKRRNPYSDEVTSESKAIKFDQKTIEAKTWAILMNPENRRALNTPRAKVTAVRRSDSPAVDSVKGLASDLTFDNCVGCQKPTKDTNSCSHCHRIICDRCSGVCESCMYHFCPICRTVNYEGHGDSTYCLSCNEDINFKASQSAQGGLNYYENKENAMDCDC